MRRGDDPLRTIGEEVADIMVRRHRVAEMLLQFPVRRLIRAVQLVLRGGGSQQRIGRLANRL